MIDRLIEKSLAAHFYKGKALVIFGARQTGKTTLIRKMVSKIQHIWLSGDEPDVQVMLTNITMQRFKLYIGDAKVVVIDEAQNIPNIGLFIKRCVDQIPDIQIIATGSSAFELSDKTKESMVGRKIEIQLFPFSFSEIAQHYGFLEEHRKLQHRLIFGYYPEVIMSPGDEEDILNHIKESFLFKDVLNLDGIKNSAALQKLVQMLAYRIGSEITYQGLSRDLGISNQTVEKYIQILEQNYIIFTLNAFSRNMDNELKKGKKIYFWDLGIRNAMISRFQFLEIRDDIGALWENFIISEMMKKNKYENKKSNFYFWRNTQQAEIDLVEETKDGIIAYECKYNPNQKAKFTKSFINAYKPLSTNVINQENFIDFLQ